MLIYIFLAIFPIALGLFFPKKETDRKQRVMYFAICGAVMLLIMGCRYNGLGSVDTYHYYVRMKDAISCSSWRAFFDPDLYESGFQLFVFILSRIFNHPQWLLVISSLIYIIATFYFIDRNSNDIALSITLYITLGLWTFHLQGMRQSIAMSICLFAYELAKQKKLFKFLAAVLLATTFHQTAIVFLLIYLLVNLKFEKKRIIAVSIFSVVAVAFSVPLVDIANELFNEDYSGAVDSGGYVATAIYIIAVLVCCLYYVKRKEDVRSTLVFVLIIGLATYVMRYTGVMIAERISFYFIFSQIALIPISIKIFVPNQRGCVRLLVVALAVVLFVYRLPTSGFLPYAFFWN